MRLHKYFDLNVFPWERGEAVKMDMQIEQKDPSSLLLLIRKQLCCPFFRTSIKKRNVSLLFGLCNSPENRFIQIS